MISACANVTDGNSLRARGRVGGGDSAAGHHHRQRSDQACERGEGWQLALGLSAEMTERTLQQNTITYSAVISACAKVADGNSLRARAERTVQQNTITYSAAIRPARK